MERRRNFGRRGSNQPSAAEKNVSKPRNRNVILIAVAATVAFAIVGWIAKQVAPEPASAPAATIGNSPSPETAGSSSAAVGKMWVTSDRLAKHTCPSTSCGTVGRYFFREAADVAEIKGDWARVSKRYDASCAGGKSAYVDEGNAACTPDNGVVDGEFAEWVEAKYLSPDRPADPAEAATGFSKLVGGSDDFRIHEAAFAEAAQKLISNGECSEADFKEMGGFVKSTNNIGPVYFIYCGGMTATNRIYLDASTGRTFR